MTPADPLLDKELRRDEGVRYVEYLDSKGIPTTGVGHNLRASPLPGGWTFPLSDDQVDGLLASDLTMVFSELDAHLGWWRVMSYARQRVLANMCFNMGINTLLEFHNTLAAMQRGDYETAAEGMAASAWAGQVGDRAVRLEVMIRAG